MTLRGVAANGQEAKTMNIVSTTNVSSARRPRRLLGTRTAPSRGQIAANRGQAAAAGSRGISRGRSLDSRGRQPNRSRPERQDDQLTTVTAERPSP